MKELSHEKEAAEREGCETDQVEAVLPDLALPNTKLPSYIPNTALGALASLHLMCMNTCESW